MTSTFRFKKGVEDIEQPVLLEEEWYPVELTEDPSILPNNVLRDLAQQAGMDEIKMDDPRVQRFLEENEKAGFNMIWKVRVEDPDERIDGRKFTVYLPYPSDFDENRTDGRGMNVYDAKLERIADWADKFGGSVEGEEVTVSPGLKGQIYIKQDKAQNREELINTVDLFSGAKPYGE